MRARRRGISLVEILAAAIIGSLVAGGTLMAFVTALRIAAPPANGPAIQLVNYQIRKSLNEIACDGSWFSRSDCRASNAPAASAPDSDTTLSWLEGTFRPDRSPMPSAWIQDSVHASMLRQYTAKQRDCSGDGTPDCVQVMARIAGSSGMP